MTLSGPPPNAQSPATYSSVSSTFEHSLRFGVRMFLFLVLALTSVLPVSYFGWAQAKRLEELEVVSADRQSVAAAQAAAGQLQQAMQSYVWAAESLASQIANPGGLEPAALYQALDAHVNHQPELLGTYVADPAGVSLAHLRNTGDFSDFPISYADRDYYQAVLKTHQVTISKVGLGRFTRVLSVQVVAPILTQEGQFLGFTCSSVDLSVMTEKTESMAKGMAGGRILLVDGDDKPIADSSAKLHSTPTTVAHIPLYKAIASGKTELKSGLDERNQAVRGAVVALSSPIGGWRVIAMTPQTIIEAQARRMKQQALSLAALLVIVAR